MTSHYVYRYFDVAGNLLYVGCTNNPHRRELQHRTSPWHSESASLTVGEPMSRNDALAEERRAIADESPKYNRYPGIHSPWEPAPPPVGPPLIATSDVCAALNVSVSTVCRWVASGRLTPAAKSPGLRGGYLFTRAAVDALKAAAVVATPEEVA